MENGRINIQLEKIVDKIGSIDVTLAAQHQSLKEHMRRTEILEETIEPIKKHVNMMTGAMKFLGVIAILAELLHYWS